MKKILNIARKVQRLLFSKKITNLNFIKKLVDSSNIDTISFDLFDTLIFRRIDPPDLVRRHTCEYIFNLLKLEQIEIQDVGRVIDVRCTVEQGLRKENASIGYDFECNFEDIIRLTLIKLGGESFAEKYFKCVIDYEIETEIKILYPNLEGIKILSYLKKINKKIIIISDMYLEKDKITEILKKCGLLKYIDEIYVSSEYKLCKGSGKLFEKLVELNLIIPQHTIHIGDNYVSDFKMPVKKGIRAYWYISIGNYFRKIKVRKAIELSNLESLSVLFKFNKDRQKNIMYNLGNCLLGPLYALYIEHVINIANEKRANEIFFIAREGYLFQKIYNQLKQLRKYKDLALPEGTYAYLSRLSTALPSVRKFGIRECNIGLRKVKQQGFFSILKTYNLNPEDFKEIFKRYNINNIKSSIKNAAEDVKLHLFIDDEQVQKFIEDKKNIEKELLYRYLEQIKFFGKNNKVIFVDIGWSGSIQHNITRAFIDKNEFPELLGVYFGRNKDFHLRYVSSNKVRFEKGFACDFESDFKKGFNDYIIDFAWLFEQAAAAPHGSTVGYSDRNGHIEPILKVKTYDRNKEIEQLKYIEEIQSGILDCIEVYKLISDFCPINGELIREKCIKKMRNILKNPSKRVIREFQNIFHSEDYGTNNSTNIISDYVKLKNIFNFNRLIYEFKNSFWKEATLKQSGIPFSYYAYLGYLKAKETKRKNFNPDSNY